ncbi:MAG: hypothetical protein IJT66_04040 [Clostridia bacterium]|nr:hypothetical protein [Clostridia bacterium]
MKRMIALCLLGLFGLSACGKSARTVSVQTTGIAFAFSMTYYNECYEGNGQIDSSGGTRVTLTSPENLNGLTFAFENGETTVSYADLSRKYPLSSALESTAAELLYRMLQETFSPDATAVLENDCYRFHGQTAALPFTLDVGGSGLPISAEAPEAGLSVCFSDVTVLPS